MNTGRPQKREHCFGSAEHFGVPTFEPQLRRLAPFIAFANGVTNSGPEQRMPLGVASQRI